MYVGGAYQELHSDWHAEDGPGKAKDIWEGVSDVIARVSKRSVSILEVGCGTGAVIHSLSQIPRAVEMRLVGIDIADHPIRKGRDLYPDLELRLQDVLTIEEEFDAILFCDVLEHRGNPFEVIRHARKLAPFMVIRQSLQDNFAAFRKQLYSENKNKFGHINCWNVRSPSRPWFLTSHSRPAVNHVVDVDDRNAVNSA